jgi:hypothetical protein
MYAYDESVGQTIWKGDGTLLNDQAQYQHALAKQFENIKESTYEKIPPTVG